jgi:signal peptidase I
MLNQQGLAFSFSGRIPFLSFYKFRKLWKNDFFQIAATFIIIVAIVLGLFWGAQLVLDTPYPTLTVETGSMCICNGASCDGWSDPFNRTLHVGDLLIVQGVDPATMNTNYPDSDIIVFHDPSNPNRLIVHRIVAVKNINGTFYFQTKGDGNSGPEYLWPAIPTKNQYDMWGTYEGVQEKFVVGKVIGRIPWVGNLTLFLRKNPFGLPTVIFVIMVLVILEFVIPNLRKKHVEQNRQSRHSQMSL